MAGTRKATKKRAAAATAVQPMTRTYTPSKSYLTRIRRGTAVRRVWRRP